MCVRGLTKEINSLVYQVEQPLLQAYTCMCCSYMCVLDSGELYTDDTGEIILIFMHQFFFSALCNTLVYYYDCGCRGQRLDILYPCEFVLV